MSSFDSPHQARTRVCSPAALLRAGKRPSVAARAFTLLLLSASVLRAVSSHASAQTAVIEKADPTPGALTAIPVRAVGRTERSADGMYAFQWPGPYFIASYKGSALYFRTGSGKQDLHILVDGKSSSLLTDSAPAIYRIATPGNATHTVRMEPVNENQDTPKSIGAFSVPAGGRAVALATGPPHQIEFIGDSHTVGYGNTSATQNCTPDQVWATTDTAHSPGAVLAQHYTADFQLNAISGRGIVRNWNGTPNPTIPEAYPYVLLEKAGDAAKAHRYADPSWNPSVIILSLGTNDFSTDLHAGEPWHTRADLHAAFEDTYAKFLTTLRAAHPHALIILWATDMVHEEIANEGREVVDRLHATGDTRIDFVEIPNLTFAACHGHPSVADDETIAAKLIAAIDGHRNVW